MIDGHNTQHVTQHSLRSQIGVVQQDPFLFTSSIRENIRYGRLDATDAEVEQGTHQELLQRNGAYASLYAMGLRHAGAA